MISWPWDSLVLGQNDETGFPIYDRGYKAEELRAILRMFFSDGVFYQKPASFTVTPGEGMTVLVAPGRCFIQGDAGLEESIREMALPAATSKPRIDTVVLRWDNNIDARNIDLYVKQGVASDVPVRPTLTRAETVWELGLCDIFIPANTTSISADRITDTRMEDARCGFVTPLLDVDTTTLFNQLQAAVNRAIGLADSAISGTLAGELQDSIAALQDGKVSKSGDTMTGDLMIHKANPYIRFDIPWDGDGVVQRQLGLHVWESGGRLAFGVVNTISGTHLFYSSESDGKFHIAGGLELGEYDSLRTNLNQFCIASMLGVAESTLGAWISATVPIDTVKQSGGFALSGGQVRIPATGTYMVWASVATKGTAGTRDLNLWVNNSSLIGQNLMYQTAPIADKYMNTIINPVVVSLNAGDIVKTSILCSTDTTISYEGNRTMLGIVRLN